ncbi:MAG: nucleotidyltransferase domain-containing protein [Ignavibacteria bacterium]|nr:nucleotidyltransferase domain-containing protein [Ignavibacteria bacterium]
MAEVPANIINVVKKFINELELNNFRIQKAVLFGSYANSSYNEWSDIDLALVSEDFEGNRFNDRQKIRKIKAKIDFSISPFPFRPEDFDLSDFFVQEIVRTGIEIN